MRKSVPKVPVTDQNAKSSLTNAEAARFFGPTPLFFGEDQAQYEAIRDQISAAVGPLDFLEEIWVNDVVDLVWETLRLRRLKAALLQVAMPEGLAEILKPMLGGFGFSEAEDLAQSWCAREKAAVNKVNGLLAKAGLTIEAVKAQALVMKLDKFERIDHLLTSR